MKSDIRKSIINALNIYIMYSFNFWLHTCLPVNLTPLFTLLLMIYVQFIFAYEAVLLEFSSPSDLVLGNKSCFAHHLSQLLQAVVSPVTLAVLHVAYMPLRT